MRHSKLLLSAALALVVLWTSYARLRHSEVEHDSQSPAAPALQPADEHDFWGGVGSPDHAGRNPVEPDAPAKSAFLRGRVVLLDGLSAPSDDESGFVHFLKPKGVRIEVAVLHGRLESTRGLDGSESIESAMLRGGLATCVDRSIVGDELVLTLRLQRAGELEVVDSESRAQLLDVQVVGFEFGDQLAAPFPSLRAQRRAALVHEASPFSPIDPGAGRALWVGSPGFAWTRVDLPRHGRASVMLFQGASLELDARERVPLEGALRATLYREGELQTSESFGMRDELRFDGLLPGRYVVSFESESRGGPPRVLQRTPVELVAGEVGRVRMGRTSTVAHGAIRGTIRTLDDGGIHGFRLRFEAADAPSTTFELSGSAFVSEAGARTWSFHVPDVSAGNWKSTLDPLGIEKTFQVEGEGTSELDFTCSSIARVRVFVFDAETGAPVSAELFSWRATGERTGTWQETTERGQDGSFDIVTTPGTIEWFAWSSDHATDIRKANVVVGRSELVLEVERVDPIPVRLTAFENGREIALPLETWTKFRLLGEDGQDATLRHDFTRVGVGTALGSSSVELWVGREGDFRLSGPTLPGRVLVGQPTLSVLRGKDTGLPLEYRSTESR